MNRYRRFTQICTLILSNCYILSGLKYCPFPIMNCHACPLAATACVIGTLQHFLTIGAFPFLVLGIFLLIGSTIGRLLCGWACPFGFFQELLYKIPINKLTLPQWTGMFKYLVFLVLVILLPIVIQEPWFCKLCPVGALEAGVPLWIKDDGIRQMIGPLFHIKFLLLYSLLYLMMITERPFCRMICPAGAIFSLFKKISLFRVSGVPDKCIPCNKCTRRCPAGVTPISNDCVMCMNCVGTCKNVLAGMGGVDHKDTKAQKRHKEEC
ncbi:MAG: 4Fe-4S binding protein [Candidatus Desantisbacteria bacterium]